MKRKSASRCAGLLLALSVTVVPGCGSTTSSQTVPMSQAAPPVGTGAFAPQDPGVLRKRVPLLRPFTGTVQAIFFHPLVVYPQLAFRSSLAKGYQDWFITVTEFERMLPQIYANGYILVSPYDLFSVDTRNGKQVVVPKTLLVPPGKKPLLLSIDDLNYYNYMRKDGNCYRLVLDASGNVATDCVTPSGKVVVSEGNGIIPILDRFVAEHPDFSLNGAKGMINETGYQGVLGYRTQAGSPDRLSQIQAVKPVIARLKATGWVFASHSWGHLDDSKISYASFVRDTSWWMQQVEPLVGPTSLYVYPFGAAVPPASPKMRWLEDQGFHMLFGVGPAPYWRWGSDYVALDRVHVDGMSLMTQPKMLAPFFDAATVVDYPGRGLPPPAAKR